MASLLEREERQREWVLEGRLQRIESKIDLAMMKIDFLASHRITSTGPRVDWGKIIESLWLRATVLILLWSGTLKMGDVVALLMKN
jgi:hypothetical protein